MADVYGLSRQDVETLREIKRRSNQTPFGPQQRRGRWPANVPEAPLRLFKVVGKNFYVDARTSPIGGGQAVGGDTEKVVIARPVDSLGEFLEDPTNYGDQTTGVFPADSVGITIPPSFRGFIVHGAILTAKRYKASSVAFGTIEGEPGRRPTDKNYLALGCGEMSTTGIVTAVFDQATVGVTIYVDDDFGEVEVDAVNLYEDTIQEGALVAVAWELVPQTNLRQSRLRVTDYGCPVPGSGSGSV